MGYLDFGFGFGVGIGCFIVTLSLKQRWSLVPPCIL